MSSLQTLPDSALRTWRLGLQPLLSGHALRSLRDALARDDAKLIQNATTNPPPLPCVADWPCERACAVAFTGFSEGLETVGEIEEYFARMCAECDKATGEPASVRWFLNAWDESPRAVAVAGLLAEVEKEIARRYADGEDVAPPEAAAA
jgi:hypothetical protein